MATTAATKIQPLADRVVVQALEETEQTRGGLYIPDTAKEKPQAGQGRGRRSRQAVGRGHASRARRRSRQHRSLRQIAQRDGDHVEVGTREVSLILRE